MTVWIPGNCTCLFVQYIVTDCCLASGEVKRSSLRAFEKLRKATISDDVMTVVLVKLGSHWTNFHGILYLSIFRKSVEKVQV
jgi:hypothetical protein